MRAMIGALEDILIILAHDDGSAEPPSSGWVAIGTAIAEHHRRAQQFVDLAVIIKVVQYKMNCRLSEEQTQRAARFPKPEALNH